ncbi:MAG TPA: TIR domain-containing protein [Eoetvoesiella sp.]
MKIFISCSNEDLALVEPYYARLRAEGFKPWMVDKDLLPNQNRMVEVEKAFASANVIMMFISSHCVSQSGFIQLGAQPALRSLEAMFATDKYVIPVILEPQDVSSNTLNRLQHLSIRTYDDWMTVIRSLRLADSHQKQVANHGACHGPFRVFAEETKEAWMGRPGHDIAISYPHFESMVYPVAALELTTLFSGRAASETIRARTKPWSQLVRYCPDGPEEQEKFLPKDGRWDKFTIDYASNSLLSLFYTVGTYSAGAAQPNSIYQTYNFLIYAERVVAIMLPDLFAEDTPWLEKISEICITRLYHEFWKRMNKEPSKIEMEWIQRGAGARDENFAAFTISAQHVSFLFAPFQVAAYELGSLRVDIPYHELRDVLRFDGVLDILAPRIQSGRPATIAAPRESAW